MRHALLALAALLGLVAPVSAQSHAHAKLYARESGDTVQVAVEIAIDHGWHLYHGPKAADLGDEGVTGKPTTIELEGEGITFGGWRFPTPKKGVEDFGTPKEYRYHEGTIVVWRAGHASAGAKLDALTAKLDGLTCESGEGGTCVPYRETITSSGRGEDALFAKAPSDLSTTPKPVEPRTSSSKGPSKSTAAAAPEEAGNESSLVAFLISAVLWGLFTLLMPCTYPMIPITISYFTKQATARNTSTLPLSLAYGAGIVAIFVLIGVVVGPVIIPFATHPVTNLLIGALFLVFALTLFGVMNLQPPAFLMQAAGNASQRGGYAGVFLMGATLVVTSFTCTAPFVGTLLSTGAASGGVGRIALGMGVFGLTMAVPFVFLSMVPARIKAIPKSGEWMHTLKVWLGFVEVVAALKFVSNADLVWNWGVLSKELFLAFSGGTMFCAAAYLLGWIRIKDEYGAEEPATIGPKRMVGGVLTLLFATYCFYGMLGHRLDPIATAIVPPYSSKLQSAGGGEVAGEQTGHVIVENDFEGAMERAAKEGKLVLANFTGHSCVNCRLMEEHVFPLPRVSAALRKGFIEARLYTDGFHANLEHIKELQQKYTGSIANPYFVVIDTQTSERKARRAGFIPEDSFLEFLKSGGAD